MKSNCHKKGVINVIYSFAVVLDESSFAPVLYCKKGLESYFSYFSQKSFDFAC